METPSRARQRKSLASGLKTEPLFEDTDSSDHDNEHAKEENTATNGISKKSSRAQNGTSKKAVQDFKVDNSGHFEFGGSAGVSAVMIGFPLLMWYMWIGATYYGGKFPTPEKGQSFVDFVKHLGHLLYVGAFPTLRAWTIYWVFFLTQGAFYLYMPGIYMEGKPLEHLGGKKLQYYCSGVPSFYSSIALSIFLHVTGIFSLYTLLDEFGPILSVAIFSGIIVSVVAYISALARGAEHRMTGHVIYDFFMGAELNPRFLEWLDFKMFFEVRLPWFMLFFMTFGACARQYQEYGFVSGELAFMLMAHWLYANACCKGEELIPPTWDMYYEKWGFMLIFWNMAGVPLSYCHSTIYLANHPPSEYRWPRWFLVFLFVSYLGVYYIWDTCSSQKNSFRAAQRGILPQRKAFPQLPWNVVKNPRTIPVKGGDDLLADGWYKYARKIHYSCDMYFAITWGLITGFSSPFPWFYPFFFACMIVHRAQRDIERCRERYGEAWAEYEKQCPYLFIPVSRYDDVLRNAANSTAVCVLDFAIAVAWWQIFTVQTIYTNTCRPF